MHLFTHARLRLTVWYLLILGLIVAVLSIAVYRLIVQVQEADMVEVHHAAHHYLAHLFADDKEVLAYQILAVDAGLLIVAAIGGYFLAGRTLRPIEKMVERQRRFAAAASHELRTPLTALQGNVEVALLERHTPEEYEQILQETVEDTVRMSELMDDLLGLAQINGGTDLLNRQEVDLAQIARAAAEDIRVTAAGPKRQTVDVHLPDELPVVGDALKLRQALLNLLDNASTYSPMGGVVTVRGESDGSRVRIVIEDRGSGIPPEDLPHIFEPFYRVDQARSGREHAGLGLALVDWIVRAHGGHIEVQSAAGAGSTFTISLPSAFRCSGWWPCSRASRVLASGRH